MLYLTLLTNIGAFRPHNLKCKFWRSFKNAYFLKLLLLYKTGYPSTGSVYGLLTCFFTENKCQYCIQLFCVWAFCIQYHLWTEHVVHSSCGLSLLLPIPGKQSLFLFLLMSSLVPELLFHQSNTPFTCFYKSTKIQVLKLINLAFLSLAIYLLNDNAVGKVWVWVADRSL